MCRLFRWSYPSATACSWSAPPLTATTLCSYFLIRTCQNAAMVCALNNSKTTWKWGQKLVSPQGQQIYSSLAEALWWRLVPTLLEPEETFWVSPQNIWLRLFKLVCELRLLTSSKKIQSGQVNSNLGPNSPSDHSQGFYCQLMFVRVIFTHSSDLEDSDFWVNQVTSCDQDLDSDPWANSCSFSTAER